MGLVLMVVLSHWSTRFAREPEKLRFEEEEFQLSYGLGFNACFITLEYSLRS